VYKIDINRKGVWGKPRFSLRRRVEGNLGSLRGKIFLFFYDNNVKMERSILFTVKPQKNVSLNRVKSKILSNLYLLQKLLNDDEKYEKLRLEIIEELHKKNDLVVHLKEDYYTIEILDDIVEEIDLSKHETEVKESSDLEDIDENNTCLFDFCDE
jgi:hypothetical protein